MKRSYRRSRKGSEITGEQYPDTLKKINDSTVDEISWLLEQLQQSTLTALPTQNFNIQVLPTVLADLSGHTSGPVPSSRQPSDDRSIHPTTRFIKMSNIDLRNANGTWTVVTPSQIYAFPSYQLAQNFYESLLSNLV
ncbi:MAG: hypothetical protein AAFZ80_08400 [Cyanobacteria bacterium P01_A01_bin.105]